MNATTVVSTDLLTPLGAYLRLREGGAAAFLLESVEHGRLGRHSFVGCGSQLLTFDEAAAAGEPVVGYLGYDHVARLEPTVPLPEAGRGLPESRFVVADTLVRFDHALGMAEVLRGDAATVTELLEAPLPPSPDGANGTCERAGAMRRLPSRMEYERAVVKAKEHIRAGDAFQIVLSQRAERPTSASALELYRSLRRVNPSPYLFLLELGELSLVGSSPETLVKLEVPPAMPASDRSHEEARPRARRASLNPIAGTTRPGPGDAERLLSSEKDRAEHVMLVDLGRNDLSRVCVPGTVEVERFLEPERFSHVTHLVSEVAGELRAGVTPFDLLRACFPAGTVSGAPKVRAMQIISELERHRRGPYAGAVGYALGDGSLDTCIAIRTIVLHEGVALLQAGAGIVADSDPAAEHDECLRKLAALETAIELAEARHSPASSGAVGRAAPEAGGEEVA
jgi:anthranilate synthase component 1